MQFSIIALTLLAFSVSAAPVYPGTAPKTIAAAPQARTAASTVCVDSKAPAAPNTPNAPKAGTVDPSLVPIFSIKTGSGIANGIRIPVQCPPARQDFIDKLNANVAAGHVILNNGRAGSTMNFNTDVAVQDAATNSARATAMLETLQSFTGVAGVGCPAISTPELLSQQKTGVFV